MWIMSTTGFISMVRHNKIPNTMLVRARVKADLEATFPGYPVETHPGADYLYRALVPVEDVALIVAEQIRELDYTSHAKDEMIRRSPRTEVGNRGTALYATWNAFANLQPYAPYAKTPRPKPTPWRQPALPLGTTGGSHRVAGDRNFASGYDWSSHPQSASYVGPETLVPEFTSLTEDDYADIPDEAFALDDAGWARYLEKREADKQADRDVKPAKKKRRGGRKHRKH